MVFHPALGSGYHRTEVHTWLNKNIRHQKFWSKVSLYSSPSLLSDNQLARARSVVMTQVIIPALAPTLDISLPAQPELSVIV